VICLSDNDVLLKLGAWDLLEEAITVLETRREDIFVLRSARYKIRKDARGELAAKYGPDGARRVLDFIETVREIEQGPDPEEQAAMIAVKGIDEGEEVLFSATKGMDAYIVATGDKNSLRALAAAPTCTAIYQRLRGRVICLEQIVTRLIPHIGFEQARSQVVPLRGCDKSIQVAFGSGLLAEEANVKRSLSIRINQLRSEVGLLLISDNEWVLQAE